MSEALLRKGKIDEALQAIRDLPARGRAAREERRKLLAYVENHRDKMIYPELEAQGLPIGSGAVESGCKRVVGKRHKQAGMRWSRPGVGAMLSLAAFRYSRRWDAFWTAKRAA
ncbi:hypothetical protein LIP_1236 [Limnochorda pilosa]|uniref:Transposase n=1 Tax=Limnochorda pilosa TaxID=1555112 RepID=A0A0K2SJ14_LIMPI|nr:hypothetical protein LIP_1236 [Limnochorda pilosa]